MEFDIDWYMRRIRRMEQQTTKRTQQEVRKIYQEALQEIVQILAFQRDVIAATEQMVVTERLLQVTGYAGQQSADMIYNSTAELYQDSYTGGMATIHKISAGNGTMSRILTGIAAVGIGDVLERPINGITLRDTLVQHQQTLHWRVKQGVQSSGGKANVIVANVENALQKGYNQDHATIRTQHHRFGEAARTDSMAEVDKKLSEAGAGVGIFLIWHNMDDEKVRPRRGRLASGKLPSYSKGSKADHVRMEGQTIRAGEYFDLGGGVKAKAPGTSGDPANDINCRCFTETVVRDILAGFDGERLEKPQFGESDYETSRKNEPTITNDVVAAIKSAGAKPVGLENRIKTKGSYDRKIARSMKTKGVTRAEAIKDNYDTIRYTAEAAPEKLTGSYRKIVENLQSKGYNTIRVRNSWLDPNNPYKGVNTVLQAPNGQKFEVQYHTPESFALKNGDLHRLYKQARELKRNSAKYIRLQEEMLKLSSALEAPSEIGSIQ